MLLLFSGLSTLLLQMNGTLFMQAMTKIYLLVTYPLDEKLLDFIIEFSKKISPTHRLLDLPFLF